MKIHVSDRIIFTCSQASERQDAGQTLQHSERTEGRLVQGGKGRKEGKEGLILCIPKTTGENNA